MSQFINLFIDYAGEGVIFEEPSEPEIELFVKELKASADETNIIIEIWKTFGLRNYLEGLFCFVNPSLYNPIAQKFPDISSKCCVFAKSSLGCLFLLDELAIGKSVIYLNPHLGIRKIIGTSLEILLAVELGADSFWKRECYGKFELKVIEKYGPLDYDECYAFVPALALGGTESMKNIQKVKAIQHLEFLSQLY
ncbi:MAG: T6SS immunity protein Tdi1 domain-containing protein [Crocinitomicaceae bacterium]